MLTSVDHAVASLYEAAVDDSRWTAALERVAELVDAVTAICFVHDAPSNRLLELKAKGFDPAWTHSYAAHYHSLDPARRVIETTASGVMRPMHRHVPDSTVARSEYYQDFYLPTGLRYSCGGAQVVDEQRIILAVHRPQGQSPYDENAVAQLQRVLDQLPAVFRVRAMTRESRHQGMLSMAVLSQLQRSVFVLNRKMSVLYLNAAAQTLMRRGAMLRTAYGRLCVDTASLTAALEKRVASACARPPSIEAAPLYALDGSGRATLELQVAPLPSNLFDDGPMAQPLALLTVRRPFALQDWNKIPSRPYGLTDAEFRLVAGMVEGLTPEEYAQREKVSINTVRTHVRAALAKTGAHRLSEMVALFAPLELLNGDSSTA